MNGYRCMCMCGRVFCAHTCYLNCCPVFIFVIYHADWQTFVRCYCARVRVYVSVQSEHAQYATGVDRTGAGRSPSTDLYGNNSPVMCLGSGPYAPGITAQLCFRDYMNYVVNYVSALKHLFISTAL